MSTRRERNLLFLAERFPPSKVVPPSKFSAVGREFGNLRKFSPLKFEGRVEVGVGIDFGSIMPPV